jgi:hypothetical protein
METDEVLYLYDLNRSDLYQRLNPVKNTKGTYLYKNIIYGDISGRFYNGKIADAFLNHIGATHWEILNSFSQSGQLIDADHLLHSSVKAEERAIHKLNFVHLLMASTNRTAWYTGGDLIVTNTEGKVVANI